MIDKTTKECFEKHLLDAQEHWNSLSKHKKANFNLLAESLNTQGIWIDTTLAVQLHCYDSCTLCKSKLGAWLIPNNHKPLFQLNPAVLVHLHSTHGLPMIMVARLIGSCLFNEAGQAQWNKAYSFLEKSL